MVKARTLATALLAAALLLAGGCGGKQETNPAAPAAAAPGGQAPTTQPPATPSTPAQGQPASGKYPVVAQQSKATYTVNEKFADRDLPTEAVGSTTAFTGELVLDAGVIKPSKVTVDLRTLKSDSANRDRQIQNRWLESNKYPYAEFNIKGAEGDTRLPADGQEVALKLTGTMKIHDTEKPMTFNATASVKGDTILIRGKVEFSMKQFNFDPPSVAGLLEAKDLVKLQVDVTAKKG